MAKPYVPYDGPIVTREQAKAHGLTRFFPGSRCRKAGHLSERMVSNGGCAACLLIHSEKWQKANPEKMKAAIAAWTDANRERVRAKGRKYSKAHQAETAAAKRRRRADRLAAKVAARIPDPSDYTGPVMTRERARSAGLTLFFTGKPCINNHLSQRTTANGGCYRCNSELRNELYYIEGPEQKKRRKASRVSWKRSNPEKVKVEYHRRRARKRAAEGSHTADELKALFQQQRGRCAYCSKSIRNGYHVDHIVALARGGSNWITNISLACAKCNTSKGATDPIIFARRLGKLL